MHCFQDREQKTACERVIGKNQTAQPTFILSEEERSRCFSVGDKGASSSCFWSWSSISFESSLAMMVLTCIVLQNHVLLLSRRCGCIHLAPRQRRYTRALIGRSEGLAPHHRLFLGPSRILQDAPRHSCYAKKRSTYCSPQLSIVRNSSRGAH